MEKEVLIDTLAYLKGQKDEREVKLAAYNEAKAELEAAKEKVVSFGDMSGIISDVEKLNGLICRIEDQINGEPDSDVEQPQEEGVADEVVVTEAEA